MTLEMGKAVAESKAEIAYSAEFFRWFSGESLRIDGYYKVAGNAASRVLVMRQPVGPSFFITPWNFPMAMGTRQRGRLHDGLEATAADAPLGLRASPAVGGRRPSGRSAQRHHELVVQLRRR